jgi:hypothetical protein
MKDGIDHSERLNNARLVGQDSPADFHVPKNGAADNYSQKNESDGHEERLNNAREGSVSGAMNKVRDIASLATPMGAFSVLKQIKFLADLPYAAALGAAILKDLLDLVFIGSLPGVGTVITILCSIFIFMMMLLVGSGNKKKAVSGMFKKGGLILGGTLVEFLPGLDFLPIETLTVAGIYYLTLVERMHNSKVNKYEQDNEDDQEVA